MKEKHSLSTVVSETIPAETNQSSTEAVQRHWQGVVKRRSFLKGLGIAGATLSASAILGAQAGAETPRSTGKLSRGDAALLRFAAAVELIEADLWQQYNELGGVQGAIRPTSQPLAILTAICHNTSPITPTMNSATLLF